MVGCSNGTTYSIDALELLDEAGYSNLVGLKGCACLQADVLPAVGLSRLSKSTPWSG